MKCTYCNAEWNIPGQTNTLVNCPFCGKKLTEELSNVLDTLGDVLLEIATSFGVNTLKDGRKTLGLFSDLAPHLKKERLLLTHFIDANREHIETIFAARAQTETEQRILYLKAFNKLVDEWAMREDAATLVCKGYFLAVGINFHIDEKEVLKLTETQNGNTRPTHTNGVLYDSSLQDNANSLAKHQNGEKRTCSVQVTGDKSATVKKTTNLGKTDLSAKDDVKDTSWRKATNINTFSQYQKALEDYYISQGKQPLTESQIGHFLSANSLDKIWRITVADVQKDLKDIYSRFGSKVATATKSAQRINTYAQYQEALEDYYISQGKQPLTESQIRQFLSANSLDQIWRITVADVQKDLKTIYSKF